MTDSTRRHWNVMEACALRFDGYRYHEQRNPADANDAWLYDVAQTFVETNALQLEPLDNWAAFFSLQRRIGHCQIELPDAERAFVRLFLHLHQEPTPAAFIKAEYQRKWEQYADRIPATVQWAEAENGEQ